MIISFDDIEKAAKRLDGVARKTPAESCTALNTRAGRQIFLKCENLQRVGAFKFRGAWNAISQLDEETAKRGVVTHSSGNHGQAVALAAKLRDIPAHIVMPENASAVKRRAVEGYGAKVIPCAPTLAGRQATAKKVQEETNAAFIPPYDHPHIIAGQGTAALELLQTVPDLDAIIAPVGGGGLLSGTALAAKALSKRIRVFGAEPLGADDAARSLAAGELIPQTDPQTLADGLRSSLGALTWPIIRDHVEDIVTVSEEEIVAAMRFAWERTKMIVEPSSAVAIAAIFTDNFKALEGMNRIGVIISGGNVDLDRLPWQ